ARAHGQPGRAPVRGLAAGQPHALRRRHRRRRDRGRAGERRPAPVARRAARRPGHAPGRGRHRPVGWRGPAGRLRPRVPARPRDGRARRGVQRARPCQGGGRARRYRPAAERADRDRDRAPAHHARERGRGGGDGVGPHRRARSPGGADWRRHLAVRRPAGRGRGLTVASMGAWRAGVRTAWHDPRRYLPGGSLWALTHSLPLLSGLALKAVFDRATAAQPAYGTALALLAVLAGVELGRTGVFWGAMAAWPRWWHTVAGWLRANLLESLLSDPGPPVTRLPATPGEAIGRFRDDVEDMIWL